MFKTIALVSALALSTSLSFAAQDVVHAVEGTVTKVDSATKTVAVKTADGTEHTFHYLGDVTVHLHAGVEVRFLHIHDVSRGCRPSIRPAHCFVDP